MTEKSKKDNLKEVNRYNDSAFPVGMYTVTVDGIEPEGQGIFINKNLLHVTNDLTYRQDSAANCRIHKEAGTDADYAFVHPQKLC